MTFDELEILKRLHKALVRELHTKDPEHIHAPFTVAEIYQNLVPYRTHRDELGVEMNADYEHALLRLLAGEGDFLSIESTTARKEIREELDTPNPNTGLYRDFAAADVRLNPEKLDVAFLDEILGADPKKKLPDQGKDFLSDIIGPEPKKAAPTAPRQIVPVPTQQYAQPIGPMPSSHMVAGMHQKALREVGQMPGGTTEQILQRQRLSEEVAAGSMPMMRGLQKQEEAEMGARAVRVTGGEPLGRLAFEGHAANLVEEGLADLPVRTDVLGSREGRPPALDGDLAPGRCHSLYPDCGVTPERRLPFFVPGQYLCRLCKSVPGSAPGDLLWRQRRHAARGQWWIL